jgi:tyrosyl-tRNA synthetase
MDGREKMSKSLGNTIAITDPPNDVYGKVMSIPDALMPAWVRVLGMGSWVDLEARIAALEGGEGDPMGTKELLAARVVERLHGGPAAEAAASHFRRVVRERELPDEIPTQRVPLDGAETAGLLDVLRAALGVGSNAEGRRLVVQGAVEIDGVRIQDPSLRLGPGTYLIRAGKRRMCRVHVI